MNAEPYPYPDSNPNRWLQLMNSKIWLYISGPVSCSPNIRRAQ
jgi:hypothetical protein